MKKRSTNLSYRNLTKNSARSVALIILAAFLSLSVFGGTIIVSSLRSGLISLQNRLGADIMVVPYEAAAESDLENIVLQGNPGYFYMDSDKLSEITALDGVGQVSAQFYLASTGSDCCSFPIQIIGFDPATDFTIQPWIKKSYQKELKDFDVVVGNDINSNVGGTLTFYGTQVHVAAKLDKTGTALDTAVYTNENTIRTLIRSSLEKGLNDFGEIDPEQVVSCILINVSEGYTVNQVINDINIHVRKVKSVPTKNMISGISGSLKGFSDVIGILTGAIWVLALVIMTIVFGVSVGARKKEFAVLRIIGASRKKLSDVVMMEGLIISVVGSLTGILVGCVAIFPFCNLIEEQLGLPFLLPQAGRILIVAVLSLLVSAFAGCLTCAVASYRISKIDTALILREGN